jgi:hypothetical protein
VCTSERGKKRRGDEKNKEEIEFFYCEYLKIGD